MECGHRMKCSVFTHFSNNINSSSIPSSDLQIISSTPVELIKMKDTFKSQNSFKKLSEKWTLLQRQEIKKIMNCCFC